MLSTYIKRDFYKLKNLKMEFNKHTTESNGILQNIIQKSSIDIQTQFDKQIIDKLESLGFSFKHGKDMKEFANTRLRIVQEGKNKMLFVDFNTPLQQLVGSWVDEYKLIYDPYKMEYKITYNEK